MANFTPSKKTAQDFNNGVEYVDGVGDIEGDAVNAESINNVIESQLWTQALATNPVDNSEADNVGTASIELSTMSDGTPRLKVKNIKGKQGNQGIQGAKGDTGNGISSATISYATGTSGTTAPSSGWQSTVPFVSQGSYLWTRTVTTYTNGTIKTSYSSAYQGKDSSVNSSGTYPQMTVGNANKLVTPRSIDGFLFDGTTAITSYATCSTSSSTAEKVVAPINDFELAFGARVIVKFTNANSVTSPTLNVNSTGAKPIKADGDTTYVKWLAGSVMEFVYDGTYWVCIAGYQLAGMRIGCIYQSTSSTSPATLYGGSWTAIQERFILGQSSTYPTAGDTGGEATHTLTISEMPSHSHEASVRVSKEQNAYSPNSLQGTDMWWNDIGWVNIGDTGGNQPHNNMPPYYVAHIWRRTA